ncbi:MAG TPA: diguanylate cyclase, partial [Chromatiales bacterium]|nr:diguanylate cyclase [Chromatiales bacterium]
LHERIADLDWAGLGMPPVTFSIGFACHPDAQARTDRLLALADAALYRAKAMGRNQTRFASEPAG